MRPVRPVRFGRDQPPWPGDHAVAWLLLMVWLGVVLCLSVFCVPLPGLAWVDDRGLWEAEARANGDPTDGLAYAAHREALGDWPGAIVAAAEAVGLPPGETLRVAACETGGTYDPRSTGAAGERGVLQIHPIHRPLVAALGYGWDDLYRVVPGVVVAHHLWARSGWAPWSCRP